VPHKAAMVSISADGKAAGRRAESSSNESASTSKFAKSLRPLVMFMAIDGNVPVDVVQRRRLFKRHGCACINRIAEPGRLFYDSSK
jgi:hypothetical protein